MTSNRSVLRERVAIVEPPRQRLRAPSVLLAQLPGASAVSNEARALVLLVGGGVCAPRHGIARELMGCHALDWSALFDLAVTLWVHPLLAHVLESGELRGLVPNSLHDRLELARLAARARWHAYVRELTPVLTAYQQRSVPVVVLKGAAMMERDYPAGSRMANDVDLWVPPDCLRDAARVLEHAGFTRYAVDGGSAEENRRRYSGWVYTKPRGEVGDWLVVDLHERLHAAAAPFFQDAAACARRATQTTIGGMPLPAFQREDVLVHLACELGIDRTITLQRLADFTTLIGAGDCDWDAVADRAREARAAGAAALALAWARAAGAPVPIGFISRLSRACPGSRVAMAPMLDLRRLIPGFRLSTVSELALGAWLAQPGLQRGRVLLSVPLIIARWQRLGGASALVASAVAVRAVPLMFATCVLARASALAQRWRRARWVDRINGWLWFRRNREGVRQVTGAGSAAA